MNDADLNNLYINRNVTYNENVKKIKGKLMGVTDCPYAARDLVKEFQKDINALQLNTDHFYLVQYERGPMYLMQTILHENEITEEVGTDLANLQEVQISDGDTKQMARILYTQNTKENMEAELMKLKVMCMDEFLLENNQKISMNKNPWLLVQYSTGINNTIYSIVRYEDTIFKDDNLYRNTVAYLKDDKMAYQAIILSISLDRKELDLKLSSLQQFCLNLKFPLDDNDKTDDDNT